MQYCQELDVWGGDFYSDEFYAAIEQLGPKLTKLNLVHIEELDFRAISLLSQCCSNLSVLGFYNCGFREVGNTEAEGFVTLDRMARREEEAEMMSLRWLDLEKLNITSEVRHFIHVLFLTINLFKR